MDPKGKSGLARIRLPNVDYRRCSETRRKERLFLEREVGESEKGWINLGEKIEDIDTQPYKYQYN